MNNSAALQYYNLYERCLAYPQSYKIRRLLELNRIQPGDELGEWVCLPVPGYNTRTYTMTPNHHFHCGWECNCQGFQSKVRKGKEPHCSHINALRIHQESAVAYGQMELSLPGGAT